jgi:hypothetical protein
MWRKDNSFESQIVEIPEKPRDPSHAIYPLQVARVSNTIHTAPNLPLTVVDLIEK